MRVQQFIAIYVLSATAHAAADTYSSYVGLARQQKSGRALYQEQHFLRSVAGAVVERVVLYQCPSGQAFGRKLLTRQANPFAPEFALIDQRTGYQESLRWIQGKPQLSYQMSVGKPKKTEAIAASDRFVADAGFDEFVRANWSALLGKKTVPLDFAVPAELDYYGFKLAWQKQVSIEGQSAEVFKLGLSGVLGWVTSAIEVSYDSKTLALRRFSGLSNIRDLAGDNYVAIIDFPTARSGASDAAAFGAAKLIALVNRCAD